VAVPRYSLSADNITALRTLKGTLVNVGPFTAKEPGVKEILCRLAAQIQPPDGETFENYVRKAFIDDLKVSELYSTQAPITLTGRLDELDFSSNSSHWNIALTITSSNGRALSVGERYEFAFTFGGDTACNEVAKAFVPAVQNLIGRVIQHPEFPGLVR
jgi:hypothetical protein